MLANLPIVRSVAARNLFLIITAITVAIRLWYPNGQGLTRIFYLLYVIQDAQATLLMLGILVVAALLPTRSLATPILRSMGRRPIVAAASATLLLCLGSVFVYRNHPLAMDEYAQYFQSQVFARGHLSGQFPPALLDWLIPRSFQNYFLAVSRTTGAVASQYWPAFALLLAPFTALGIPWACNPIISGLTLIAVHRLALRLFGSDETAGLAVLFTAASPVFFANGISYYSMPAHLLANTVYALLLLDPTPRRALLAGIVGSVALTLHNPVPHLLFALPWLLWVATRSGGLKVFGWLILGYAPLCAILGVGWFWFYSGLDHAGEAAAANLNAQYASLQTIAGIFRLPTAAVVLARTIGVAKVWVWAVPGLMVLAAAGAWRWRNNPACRLLAASALVTLLGYLLVPVDQGHGWGYRYFHAAWIALPVLAAGALTTVSTGARDAAPFDNEDTRAFVLGCALLTLAFGVGLRGLQIHEFVAYDLQQLPAYKPSGRRVVIIDPSFAFYGADLVQNDPWLRGEVIRMITHERDSDMAMMSREFPDFRRVYADRYGYVWADPAAPTDSHHSH